MRIKNLLSSICVASFAALSLVGCSDYDNGYTEQQLQFIKNFKEIYGEVDPTQDWNLAERAKVTVTVSKPSNIQIFAKADGRYRIVGDYKNVSGTRTLGFDVVKGTKDIMVSDGRTAQYTTLGGSVTFAGTRTIFDKTAVSKKNDDYSAPLDKKTYSAWRSIVPEKQFNLGKVVEDFVFVSTGKFTIYPIYWHTTNTPELGIYYLNENYDPNDENSNELVEIGIYKIKYDKADSKINKDENGNALSYDGDKAEIQVGTIVPSDGSEIKYDWKDAKEGWSSTGGMPFEIDWDNMDQPGKAPDAIRSKGIEIDLPVGTVFGMFLIDNGDNKFYSNSNRNEKPGVTYSYTTGEDDGETVDTKTIVNDYNKGACHACAFMDNGRLYLGFEDWVYAGGYQEEGDYDKYKEIMDNGGSGYSDFDMNDCIFMFSEDIPMLVDYQAQTWILSAEDLGNTLDIDYNDVVIEVSHTSGRDEAYVTPLAAGGTLASFVYFTNSDGKEIPLGSGVIGSDGKEKTGEIHELFSNDYGKAANWISGRYSPINVDKDKDKPTVSSKRTYTIKVDEKWSLATSVSDDKDFDKKGEAANMGGFKIKVVPENISVSNGFTGVATAEAQLIQNVVPGDEGAKRENVPYVICTQKYWTREDETGHYRWPRESMPMLQMTEGGAAAYNTEGHKFEDWVRDKTQATDWYKYPDPDNTTAPTGLGINPEASLQGSIGGGTGGGDPTEPDAPKNGEDLYFKIGKPNGSGWRDYTSETSHNGNVNIDDYSDFVLNPGDNLFIETFGKDNARLYRDVTATYSYNDEKYYLSTSDPYTITIPLEGGGNQSVTLYAPEHKTGSGEDEIIYGERIITISFTVQGTGNNKERKVTFASERIQSGKEMKADNNATLKGSYISFKGITIEDYIAGTLTVECSQKPGQTVAWIMCDDEGENSKTIKDNDYDGWDKTTLSITLDKETLQEIVQTGGIFVGVYDYDNSISIVPTKVTLKY